QPPHKEQEQPSEPFSTDDAPEPQSAPLPRVGEERALSAVLGRIREKRQGQQSDSDNLPKTAKIPNSTDERDCDESETEIPAQVTAEQDEATQEHRDIDREADKGGSARKHVKATAALLLVIVAAGAFWIYGMFAPTFMVGQWQPDKSLYDRMLSEAAKGKPREERETLYKESAVFRNAKLSIDSENITTTWPNLGYRNSYRIVSSIESELNLDVDYLQNATSRWQVRKTPTGIEIQRGAKLPVPFKRMPPKSAKNPKIRNPLDGHWIGPVAGTVIDVTFEGNTMTNQAGEQLIKWEQNQDTVTVTEEDGDKRRFQIKDQGRIVFLNAFQARDVTLRRQ
ncbi:MAG: hypothetical protein QF886_25510, partial [Planctomycetota bacterium]|nr:hypothetical protein [Planctomycetota bacterium]